MCSCSLETGRVTIHGPGTKCLVGCVTESLCRATGLGEDFVWEVEEKHQLRGGACSALLLQRLDLVEKPESEKELQKQSYRAALCLNLLSLEIVFVVQLFSRTTCLSSLSLLLDESDAVKVTSRRRGKAGSSFSSFAFRCCS